jgi:hypothetical protein
VVKDIFLRIAEIAMGLTSDLMGTEIQLTGATQKFLIEDAVPDIKIRILWDELREESQGREIFDSGSTWKLYNQGGSLLIRLRAPVFGSIPYKEALFSPDFSTGEIRLHRPFYSPGQPLDPLEYPLDELLITNYLGRGRGVEVHACGVVDSRGKGHLFLGQSGAGKSTLARLWHGHTGSAILSDDRIILRQKGENFWMHGTPWHGDGGFFATDCARLKTVCVLEKGPQNALILLKSGEAMGRLFACCFPPFYSPGAMGFILDFLGKVVSQVPCYKLQFLPDTRVVDLLKSSLP